jgi:hypothetical protein
MRKLYFSFFISSVLMSSVGCIKQLEKGFDGKTVAEIDAAVLNANFSGVTYPIIARYPRPGIPISTTNSTTSCELPQADSTIRRLGTGRTVNIRVNLIGAQTAEERTVGYRIISSPITTYAFPATVAAVSTTAATCGTAQTLPAQTPAVAGGDLAIVSGTPGVHFANLSGKVTIPANSSFGNIQIQVLNPGATAGSGVFVGIQLDSTGTVLPSLNYRTIGFVIDQR